MPALRWSQLGPGDLDALEALHRLSLGAVVRPEVVKPETRAFFEGILARRGRVFGVGAPEGGLIAYGILQHDLAPADDPRSELGLAGDVKLEKLAGAGVDPSWRGRGLQRALIAARVRAASPASTLFSTAAPANQVSLANLLAEGFAARALVTRYGGLRRYLLVRDPGGNEAADGASRDVDIEHADEQVELFARGWQAVAFVPGAGRLRFVARAGVPR